MLRVIIRGRVPLTIVPSRIGFITSHLGLGAV